MELFCLYDFWIMSGKADHLIQFHYLSGNFHFRDRRRVKSFLVSLIKTEGFGIDHINYIFCSNRYLLDINREYLSHNTYTDIITFELSGKGQPLLADIYISVDRVHENARIFTTSFKNELHRVIFHGALHLCGYTDKSRRAEQQMRLKESFYLSRYFVPRGTI